MPDDDDDDEKMQYVLVWLPDSAVVGPFDDPVSAVDWLRGQLGQETFDHAETNADFWVAPLGAPMEGLQEAVEKSIEMEEP